MFISPPWLIRRPKQVGERRFEPLVGQGLERLQIGRHRVEPWSKRRAHHLGGQLGRDPQTAGRAGHRHAAMALHQRRDHRQVDLVVFADHFADQGRGQTGPAARALIWKMVHGAVEILAQIAAVTLVARLGATGPGLVPLSLAIRRWRLGRRARRLRWLLKTQHQLDQLALAQKLKIGPAHAILNQRSRCAARGWVITSSWIGFRAAGLRSSVLRFGGWHVPHVALRVRV
jgi:hypothetical protein